MNPKDLTGNAQTRDTFSLLNYYWKKEIDEKGKKWVNVSEHLQILLTDDEDDGELLILLLLVKIVITLEIYLLPGSGNTLSQMLPPISTSVPICICTDCGYFLEYPDRCEQVLFFS